MFCLLSIYSGSVQCTYLRCLNADEKIIDFWEGRNSLSSLMSSLLGERRDKPDKCRKGLHLRSGEDMPLVTASTFSKAPLSGVDKNVSNTNARATFRCGLQPQEDHIRTELPC